jgi:FkbM family methyltransferase
MAIPQPHRTPSFCVYTTLIGQYERLNEQPAAAASGIPFICLTDDPDLRSKTWQVRQVLPTLFGMDPIRSQRVLKICAHEYLPEFDCSLYIDNSIILTQPPEKLIEQFDVAAGIALAEHDFRDTVLDEFLAVSKAGLDDQSRIFEQLNHYMFECPEVLKEKPYWAGLMLRDHRNPRTCAMLQFWSAHVQRYSRRDQLSLNLAFRHVGLKPQVLAIGVHSSAFHSWPHTPGRDRAKWPRLPGNFYNPPIARVRNLEQQVQALERDSTTDKAALLRQLDETKDAFTADKAALLRQLDETKDAFTADNAALLRQLDETKDAFTADKAALLRQLDETNNALASEQFLTRQLRSSNSWRLTAPIRAAVNSFRSLLGTRPALAEALPSPRHEMDSRPSPEPSHPIASARTTVIFHVDASDRRGRELVLHGGDLNPPTLAIWRRLIAERPWTHVLDVGANYGEMLLNVTLPPTARVLAFEPNPLISPYLEWNLADAGIPAEIIRSAVTNRIGEAKLRINRNWSGLTSLGSTLGDVEPQALEFLTVPTTTISAILGDRAGPGACALIKIDVEGHEARVLEGLTELLDGFADFAALVELLHVPPQDREWILDNFAVELLDPSTNGLVRLFPATQAHLSTILAEGQLYAQDVVLRRKP